MPELIYGRNPVLELLKTDADIEHIFIAAGLRDARISEITGLAQKKQVRLRQIAKIKLDEQTGTRKHQGVAAYVRLPGLVDPDQILAISTQRREQPLLAILDGIEDPHNLGAILRSADGAGLHGVILPKNRSARISATVTKTSAGAVAHVKVAQVTNLSREIDALKKRGLWFVGADQDGEKNYTEVDMKDATGLIIGAEGKGLHRLVKEKCDFLVKIPMYGKINSLNASVAAALLFFEARRQRTAK